MLVPDISPRATLEATLLLLEFISTSPTHLNCHAHLVSTQNMATELWQDNKGKGQGAQEEEEDEVRGSYEHTGYDVWRIHTRQEDDLAVKLDFGELDITSADYVLEEEAGKVTGLLSLGI